MMNGGDGHGTKERRKACEYRWFLSDSKGKVGTVGHLGQCHMRKYVTSARAKQCGAPPNKIRERLAGKALRERLEGLKDRKQKSPD